MERRGPLSQERGQAFGEESPHRLIFASLQLLHKLAEAYSSRAMRVLPGLPMEPSVELYRRQREPPALSCAHQACTPRQVALAAHCVLRAPIPLPRVRLHARHAMQGMRRPACSTAIAACVLLAITGQRSLLTRADVQRAPQGILPLVQARLLQVHAVCVRLDITGRRLLPTRVDVLHALWEPTKARRATPLACPAVWALILARRETLLVVKSPLGPIHPRRQP